MNSLNRDQFSLLLKEQRIKLRLARELRFVPEEINDWGDLEIVVVGTRSGKEGLLPVQIGDFYVLPYELTAGHKDKASGRSKPIICDLCYTWQQGGKAGRITFRSTRDDHTFTYLCCGDLRCSLNVRNMTPEAVLSRSQLHEDISVNERIARLR